MTEIETRDHIQPKVNQENSYKDAFWRTTCIASVLLGTFLLTYGVLYGASFLRNTGLALISVGVLGGVILHTIFGIEIIKFRTDLRYEKTR